MKKNIVIIDVDVDFKKPVSRVKSPFGGYVSLEYYYDVDDEAFTELKKSNVLFSQFGDRSVLDVLDGKKLTVWKSQALTLFSVVPSVTHVNQYVLSESESDSAFIEFAAHMRDGCGW